MSAMFISNRIARITKMKPIVHTANAHVTNSSVTMASAFHGFGFVMVRQYCLSHFERHFERVFHFR